MAEAVPETHEKVPVVHPEVQLSAMRLSHLPQLTEKQMGFVDMIARGYTPTKAYRVVYEPEKGSNRWQGPQAMRLMANKKIEKWLNAIRRQQMLTITTTLEEHLLELKNLREMAKDEGKLHVALQAERLRGKASGLYDSTSTVLMGDINELYRQITEHTKTSNPLAVTIEGETVDMQPGDTNTQTNADSGGPLSVDFNPQELASLEQEASDQGLKVEGLEYEDELEELMGVGVGVQGPQGDD